MNVTTQLLFALLFCMSGVVRASHPATIPEQTSEATLEVEQKQLLAEARILMDQGKTVEAIATLDSSIAAYEVAHPATKTRWYVSRSPKETLAYLMMSAVDADKGTDKRDATAIYSSWADAYYLKGYALVELERIDEAKRALDSAIQLTPHSAQYQSELANIYQAQRNWPKALELYRSAEVAAAFSVSEQLTADSSRAKRGVAFVLVEQGQLDAAERKLEECLKLDASDLKAKNELEYIRQVRAKARKINPR